MGYSGEFITSELLRCLGGRKREGGREGGQTRNRPSFFGGGPILPAERERARAGVDEPGRRKIIIVPVAFACGQGQIIAVNLNGLVCVYFESGSKNLYTY